MRRKTDIRARPLYSISEVSEILKIPASTLRDWFVGVKVRGEYRFRPVFVPASARPLRLSFYNLLEAHVLDALRITHNLSLQRIRKAIRYLKKEFNQTHPLVKMSLYTDGVDIFVKEYGRLLNASREGQIAMKEIINIFLSRIDFSSSGEPENFYPFILKTTDHLETEEKIIKVNPEINYGRPTVIKKGVPVYVIYERFLAGESVQELAEDYELDTHTIENILRYCGPEKRAA